jgi:hypothetical protein
VPSASHQLLHLLHGNTMLQSDLVHPLCLLCQKPPNQTMQCLLRLFALLGGDFVGCSLSVCMCFLCGIKWGTRLNDGPVRISCCPRRIVGIGCDAHCCTAKSILCVSVTFMLSVVLCKTLHRFADGVGHATRNL